jgi:hypothetical protein
MSHLYHHSLGGGGVLAISKHLVNEIERKKDNHRGSKRLHCDLHNNEPSDGASSAETGAVGRDAA